MKQLRCWVSSVLLFVITLAALGGYTVASSDERSWEDDDHAYDRARRAVDRGEALPIAVLIERLRTQVPGEVVGVELGSEQGKWIYEFKLIDDSGRLLEIYVDGATGGILSMEHE